ncbi:MAG: hypothetical protein LUC33_03510, partial [Prevotellaceae bacterium]|nr:hypothetical protein [Prevotellaceae bacterium]
MFIGSVSCAYPQVRRHCRQIEEIKRAHNFFAEIKWSHVSMSKIDFYQDLVNYFFDTDLRFRAIGVEKNGIPCGEYGEGYDEFYYKTAYQLLNHKISTLDHYNVYLDKKDTLGQYKV